MLSPWQQTSPNIVLLLLLFLPVCQRTNSPWVSTCQQAIASENTRHKSTGFSSPKTNRARCYSPSIPWTILVWFPAQSKNNILSCTVHLGKYKLQRQRRRKKKRRGKRLSSVNTAFKKTKRSNSGNKITAQRQWVTEIRFQWPFKAFSLLSDRISWTLVVIHFINHSLLRSKTESGTILKHFYNDSNKFSKSTPTIKNEFSTNEYT